jgi:hypothetical protein
MVFAREYRGYEETAAASYAMLSWFTIGSGESDSIYFAADCVTHFSVGPYLGCVARRISPARANDEHHYFSRWQMIR